MKAHKEDRFFPRKTECSPFQVTGANDSVENYAERKTVVLQNDNIQEFDTKWDEILLSMTQITTDDILENCTN